MLGLLPIIKKTRAERYHKSTFFNRQFSIILRSFSKNLIIPEATMVTKR